MVSAELGVCAAEGGRAQRPANSRGPGIPQGLLSAVPLGSLDGTSGRLQRKLRTVGRPAPPPQEDESPGCGWRAPRAEEAPFRRRGMDYPAFYQILFMVPWTSFIHSIFFKKRHPLEVPVSTPLILIFMAQIQF